MLDRILAIIGIPFLLAMAGTMFGAVIWIIYQMSQDACEQPIMFFAVSGFAIGCVTTVIVASPLSPFKKRKSDS